MGGYTSRWDVRFGAYLRRVFSPTNDSAANWHRLDITKVPKPRAYGGTNPGCSPSPSLSTIFGIKFVNKANVNYLIASIKKMYTLTEDWTGSLHCSITLEWDYVGGTVDISMPGYIKMKLQEYEHIMPKNYKRVHTCRSQRNLAQRPKPPSPMTLHQNLTRTASNVCKK